MYKTEGTVKDITEKRIRWAVKGDKKGPVVVLFVGVHGNEKAGVIAADRLCEKLNKEKAALKGSLYVITGNQPALELGVRYIDMDLNRIWEQFYNGRPQIRTNGAHELSELQESVKIKKSIQDILKSHVLDTEEFIFADLHTTSSESCAFILLNDTLANRELARQFPVPQILGIEENIRGTLLSYINNLGHKAIGFEAGAHHDDVSITRSESFLWLLLHNTGLYTLTEPDIKSHSAVLHAHEGVPETYYEIIYHKLLDDPVNFQMFSGFENFDWVDKDTPLAYENGELIRAAVSGRIFMPLYQNKGYDGFLIIRTVSDFWLELSAHIRGSFLHGLLKYLPGVDEMNERSFRVNLNIARFLVKDIFHLLGYRVTQKSEDVLICYRR